MAKSPQNISITIQALLQSLFSFTSFTFLDLKSIAKGTEDGVGKI